MQRRIKCVFAQQLVLSHSDTKHSDQLAQDKQMTNIHLGLKPIFIIHYFDLYFNSSIHCFVYKMSETVKNICIQSLIYSGSWTQ